ncbi:alpha/beta hydrolase family protein [Undibacterium sp. TC9W]|uniref:alpha/beta hydrolase family protein n=1 Tax=Undibacterium sp. TC9W TaxID=3413053 RepID=UPI003BF04228
MAEAYYLVDAQEKSVYSLVCHFKHFRTRQLLSLIKNNFPNFLKPIIVMICFSLLGSCSAEQRPQEAAITVVNSFYDTQEVSFSNPVAKIKLAGSLTLPKGQGPFPAVILIAGSGSMNRDEETLKHKPFMVLADHLSRHGIVVLRFDKRGVGKSEGNFPIASTFDFASDVDAAIHYLRTRVEVDTRNLGLIGHSEGGTIAPMVAIENNSVQFIVMMAGSGLRGDQLMLSQTKARDTFLHVTSADSIKKLALLEKCLYAVRNSGNPAEAKLALLPILDSAVADNLISQPEAKDFLVSYTTAWFHEFVLYDPLPALRKLNIPILVLNGSLDMSIPSKQHLPAIKDALSNNQQAMVQEIPKLNHMFQTAVTGDFSEFGKIEETLSPSAMQIINEWIKRHLK